MTDPHLALGIAQTVFYAPAVPLAIYLMARTPTVHPRLAWLPLLTLSCMRLAGGPVAIALAQSPSGTGLVIAANILLNVGVVPLLVQSLRLFQAVINDSRFKERGYRDTMRLLWTIMFPALTMLIAGSSLASSESGSNTPDLSRTLTLVGYLMFALVLLSYAGMECQMWGKVAGLRKTSRKVVKGTLLAAPFLAVRNVYGILGIWFGVDANSVWNPVFGSVVLFVLMGLAMEYVVVCIYFWIGLSG